MDEELNKAIREEFVKAHKILLVCHVRPDGDAIGSLIGLGLALEAAGKTVRMVSTDGAPSGFKFLIGYHSIFQTFNGNYDLVVTVDCSEIKRAGFSSEIISRPDINIDHHITNNNFARINLVNPGAAATAEIIAENISAWGLKITKDVATALLTGIITDTIGFRTDNVTPRTLRVAADLASQGVDISEIYKIALVNRSLEAVRYWGVGLSKLQKADSLVWTSLTIDDQKNTGYTGRDDADLINVLSSIEGTSVSVIFIEQPGGGVKVSWRAQPGIDVSQIAMQFGGGGHAAAAGAIFDKELNTVQEIVIRKTNEFLNKFDHS